MHFTEGTEPSPQQSQSGQGVWLRDLGLDLCALCEKRFSSEKCDCCGLEGRKILWGGHNHALTSYSAKKWAVKDGDFCARHFLRGRFSQPRTGGTTHAKNRGFPPARVKVAFVAGAGKARSKASVTVLPPSFPLSLSHSSGLRLGEVCRPERKIKRKRKEQDSLGARPTVTPP
jgi:hypothetical protein